MVMRRRVEVQVARKEEVFPLNAVSASKAWQCRRAPSPGCCCYIHDARCKGREGSIELTLTSDRRGDEALGNEAATADDEEGGMGEHMILESCRDIMKEFVFAKS